jgi:hypothetical protein
MIKWLFYSSFALLLLQACSTKFKVGADYKEVTVIYCLLSASDTAHYVKITKGFFDEEKNNLELAAISDSIYFTNLKVEMQVINNNNIIETIPLNKVDLNLEGYSKNPGTFAQTPNYAYKFKKNLVASNVYKLHVVNLSTGKEIVGQTNIINTAAGAFQFITPLDELDLLDFTNLVPYSIRWNGPPQAAIYDVVLKFRYQEVDINNISDTNYFEKEVVLTQNKLSNTGEMISTIANTTFYKQLNSTIGEVPINIKRYVDTPGLMIVAGGYELKTYIDVNAAQGGITFDQIRPNYTNLIGQDVYGLVSTRGKIEFPKIKFNGATIDSIIKGQFTKNLRIVGISNK